MLENYRTMKKKSLPSIDQILKAIADPIRVSVIRQLLEASDHELICRQFDYQVSKPTFSHHIKTLVEAKVLIERIEGTRKFLSINPKLEEIYPELFLLINNPRFK